MSAVNMIKLTSDDGERKIYINPHWIIAFWRDDGDDVTSILTPDGGDNMEVDQTPAEINERIQASLSGAE